MGAWEGGRGGNMVIYYKTHTTSVNVGAALWPSSRARGAATSKGGATGWAGTNSTHVSTVIILHYIFKSRGGRVGFRWAKTENVWGMRDSGRAPWKRTVTSCCSPRSWSFIHHSALAWLRVCGAPRARVFVTSFFFFSSFQFFFFFFTQMPKFPTGTTLQWDVTSARRLHSSLSLEEGDETSVWEREREGRAGTRCRVLLSARFGSYCMHVT